MLTLAACTTPGKPLVQYQTVNTPVAVSCIPADAPKPPKVHTDAELKAMDGPSRFLAIASDRYVLLAYEIQASGVIGRCG